TADPAVFESGQLLFELDVGEIERRAGGELEVHRDTREVTVGVQGQLVGGHGAKRLRAEAQRVGQRNGHGELGVEPLDLDHADGVGVDVEASVRAGSLPAALGDAAGQVAAG